MDDPNMHEYGNHYPPADWITEIIRAVAELPDRNSPPDQPEMMLVTADELRWIIEEAHMARPAK